MKVLVTGAAGKLGRRVVCLLRDQGHQVLGIDRRPWPQAPEGVRLFQADVRKRPAEDVFRTERPEAVIHMATVTHLTHRTAERFRINLGGTRAVFEHAHRYGARQVVFVGRHTFYGATPDAPLYHTEEEPPMAVHSFPELADLVAADLYAGSALWRFPRVRTVVLRLCYTLGPLRSGTLATFLRGPRVPTLMGFDPLFQFVHDEDAVESIVLAMHRELRGVYNVAGPRPMPLSRLIERAGREAVALPEPLAPWLLGRFGLPRLPRGALEHLKYPVVVDWSRFREASGFQPRYEAEEAIAAFRGAKAPEGAS